MTLRRAHYVLSAHWDREWYLPFQDFRHKLCSTLDRIIAGFEEGRLAGPFTTDGQSILLDDYLEVYPEKRGQIQKLVREGKFILGPWYVLPDEFLVSGESLVRNLRKGRQLARQYGAEPSNAGFVCDLFGHVSQLPQILAGFGIHAGLLWRGVNAPGAGLMRWRGADGSEMLCYRFGYNGYCRYAGQARQASSPGDPFTPLEPRSKTELAQHLETLITQEALEIPQGPLLLFDGGDHQGWDEFAYDVLRQRMSQPVNGIEVVHSSLDAYLKELQQHADQAERLLEGELREPALHDIDHDTQWLIPGVLSSRVHLKQANARCQTLLCHWAEPMSVIAQNVLGLAYPAGFLNVAWQWLLQNHPHDSICGCSIDRVHQDMVYRFSQCEQIAVKLTGDAVARLAAHIQGGPQGDDLRVVVFNPLPEPFEQTVELTLPVPRSWPNYATHIDALRELMLHIHDESGAELPVQKLSQRWNRTRFRIHASRFPEQYPVHEVRVSVPVRIPAMGYTTLRVTPGQPQNHARPKLAPSLVTDTHTMENASLRVTIAPDGTLSILDKRSGATYSRLLMYEDSADSGDGWYYGQSIGDQIHYAGQGCVSIAKVHDGPHLATFRIRTTLPLPVEFEHGDNWKRSGRLVPQVIETQVSLRPEATWVEVQVNIDNLVNDHRLRVLMPSGAAGASTYLADSVYDAVERPIAMREDNHLYREMEVETKPQQTWTAVTNGQQGLAVISQGLYESAVCDQPQRPIALTLYRATRRTVFTDGEPDGQLRQPLQFQFWLQPVAGAINPANLCRLGQRLACGVQPSYLYGKDVALHRQGEVTLPARASFFQVEGDLILTAMEQREGRTEIRLFNPTTQPQTATLRWPTDLISLPAITQCQPVDLEGHEVGEAIPVIDGHCRITSGPKKIITLRLT